MNPDDVSAARVQRAIELVCEELVRGYHVPYFSVSLYVIENNIFDTLHQHEVDAVADWFTERRWKTYRDEWTIVIWSPAWRPDDPADFDEDAVPLNHEGTVVARPADGRRNAYYRVHGTGWEPIDEDVVIHGQHVEWHGHAFAGGTDSINHGSRPARAGTCGARTGAKCRFCDHLCERPLHSEQANNHLCVQHFGGQPVGGY